MRTYTFAALAVSLALLALLADGSTAQAPKQRTQFEADSTTVFSLAFSPDGKILASSGEDQEIKLWDPATAKSVGTLKGHKGLVSRVAFSPDGKTLASGGKEQAIRLWDVKAGKETRTLDGHPGGISSLAFSPDGKVLASSGPDKTVKLWDVASGKESATLKEFGGPVTCVAFSPDDKTLATAGGTTDPAKIIGEVKLWDVRTSKSIADLKGHTGYVQCVAFSPDGKTLASGRPDRTVKLWDVATGKNIDTYQAQDSHPVLCVAFSPDGKTLAAGDGSRPHDALGRVSPPADRHLQTAARHRMPGVQPGRQDPRRRGHAEDHHTMGHAGGEEGQVTLTRTGTIHRAATG